MIKLNHPCVNYLCLTPCPLRLRGSVWSTPEEEVQGGAGGRGLPRATSGPAVDSSSGGTGPCHHKINSSIYCSKKNLTLGAVGAQEQWNTTMVVFIHC